MKCFYFLYTGMCVFVFRYKCTYFIIIICTIVNMFYITSLHFMYMNKLRSSILFKRLKKKYIENTLSKNLYTLYHYECFNFKYSAKMDSVLDGVLSRAGQWIYLLFFSQFDIWLSMIFIYLYLLNRFNNKFNSC